MRRDYAPLLIAAVALAVLPFVLDRVGLPLRSSVDVVVFAIACLGLNVLVGTTGLASFGHGAWFGLGAYAAALSQRHWFPESFVLPALFSLLFVIGAAALVGVVRGVTIYVNPAWGEASMYLLMALVLLTRPRGLLGERIERFE